MKQLSTVYTDNGDADKNPVSMDYKYKYLALVLILALTFIHLFCMVVYPESLMANKLILIVVLAMMFYIWMRELKDKKTLQLLNENLLHAQEKLERAEIDVISALILTAEAKDPYTHGHSKRVAAYSLAIAQEMHLSEEEQKIIERAAILHDLGKIGIDDSILRKDDILSDKEWEIMKGHPQKSIDILDPLKFLEKEKEIILSHHEMIDGSGYPNGLQGEAIPLGSRIIAVADAFDAMNTARSYRAALPEENIIEELNKSSGTHLSADVTNVFLNILDKSPEFWNRAIT
ncbi:MAG: HD-GYP domain-containing protein [Candidatus Omnitrophica bacterium]|nr:HD-GYP domain-containing protein [Candidatus Omnitrophota bacterium]